MILCIKRKTIFMVAVAVILTMVFVGLVATVTEISVFNQKPLKKLPVYKVDTQEKQVALTFDAAWGADKTKKIMEILKEYKADATFFLVGFWVDKYQEEVKLINDNNFEIGNHSHNHLKMSTLSAEDIRKELSYVSDNIFKITNKKCKVFRPPFGDYNNTLIEEVNNAGMTTIQWDVDSLDWKGLTGDEITKRVTSRVTSGSIVLFHNNSDNILDALPKVLKILTAKGYKFVKVSDMLIKGESYIDNNGMQHKQNK